MKQIIFRDLELHETHAGILTDERNVICGCCGGLFEAEEENKSWKVVKVYNTWINLEEEICGNEEIGCIIEGEF